jgi:hypothetical protein
MSKEIVNTIINNYNKILYCSNLKIQALKLGPQQVQGLLPPIRKTIFKRK